ncbi:MAG TPA: FAD-dependent oxidoreductase, partial [Acidimicrobiaceae bacterium]|nr:FAD-dependent oxidoreductase [Acidimicrobiaceae bacterium]
DPGNYTYFREETGKIMVGFFEPRGKVWSLDGVARDVAFATLAEDWDHVAPVFERAAHRVPALRDCGIQLFFNGPEAFTPDGTYYLGPAAELDDCWVAAGFNSVGIQSAGGVGWALAEWIAERHPPMDLTGVDVRRAMPHEGRPEFLAARIPESLGLLYAMHWPNRQYTEARGQRVSPLHDAVAAAGAVFGETAGWERPNWFADPGQERVYEYSYGKQNWWPNAGRECAAVRRGVALFDQSSFAKFTVEGPQARAVLDRLSVADVDVAAVGDEDGAPAAGPGRSVYTQWCNDHGGIEADLTVTRLGADRFMVVTGAACQTRDWAWLRRACAGADVDIADVTEQWAMLGVMGPLARTVLAPLVGDCGGGAGATGEDLLGNDAFPFGGARRLTLAGRRVLALRMTYVGELGWELYVPAGDAEAVYDAVVAAGEPHGLRHAGYHAMNTLRLEAGYRHWGHDISDTDTPLEAGLGFTVAWDKAAAFTGAAALRAQRTQPRTKRLVQFRLEDPDVLAFHDEPITRDGVLVGRVGSAMWSYEADRCLAMGFVSTAPEGDAAGGEGAAGPAVGAGAAGPAAGAGGPAGGAADPVPVTKDWLAAGSFAVDVAGEQVPATPSIRSFYDPSKQRIRI